VVQDLTLSGCAEDAPEWPSEVGGVVFLVQNLVWRMGSSFGDVAPQATLNPQRLPESTLAGFPLDCGTGPHSQWVRGRRPRVAVRGGGGVFLVEHLVCVEFPQCVRGHPPALPFTPSVARAAATPTHVRRGRAVSAPALLDARRCRTWDGPRVLWWERRRPPARLHERHARVCTGACAGASMASDRLRPVRPRAAT